MKNSNKGGDGDKVDIKKKELLLKAVKGEHFPLHLYLHKCSNLYVSASTKCRRKSTCTGNAPT